MKYKHSPATFLHRELASVHTCYPAKENVFYPLTVISFSLILGKKNDYLILLKIFMYILWARETKWDLCLSEQSDTTTSKTALLWNIKTLLKWTKAKNTKEYKTQSVCFMEHQKSAEAHKQKITPS